jgi:hypothetical protein
VGAQFVIKRFPGRFLKQQMAARPDPNQGGLPADVDHLVEELKRT